MHCRHAVDWRGNSLRDLHGHAVDGVVDACAVVVAAAAAAALGEQTRQKEVVEQG